MSGAYPLSDLGAGQHEKNKRIGQRIHHAWQVSIFFVITAGLFHLVNLVGAGRIYLGPVLFTPFRIFFGISWALLLAGFLVERRLPRPDRTDIMVAAVAVVFLARGLFEPETLSTVVNWVATGAGVFYLVRYGTQSAADVRLVLVSVAGVVLALALIGLVEYEAKSNPLFDSIQVEAIGTDQRVQTSSQFYRIRSLVGHPGFAGAVFLGAMPLAMLVLWRRRLWMAVSLMLLATALFLTFSRGSWLLGVVVLLPLVAFRARYWVRRNVRWLLPLALIPVVLLAFDYWNREEVSIDMPGYQMQECGLRWILGNDGPIVAMSGEATGIQPLNSFVYFDVDDSFFRGDRDPVTVVIHYFDKGWGAIRLDYDSWDERFGAYHSTASINKTNTRQWTTAAFYLDDARFNGRMNGGADFRVVDEDNNFTLDRVVLQKGKLKLPSVVINQWLSRSGSISTRTSFFPFTWRVVESHPLGVGIFNAPGTDHHAVDSLPLTWMMEFGWPGLLLIGGLIFLLVLEGVKVWRQPRGASAVLFMVLAVIILHGGHLMILYDKPSLVLVAVVGAVYANIRPWRRGGPVVSVSNQNCML